MDNEEKPTKHAGGRPKKFVRRDQQLAVMCNRVERMIIETKAEKATVSVSEFLRNLALGGQVDRKVKALPKEILLFTATLNHLAANMNQVAKKRNREEELNAIERAELTVLSTQIKQFATDIKTYLK
ncbi:plasmid mobilization protein [Pinibacter soli]|uniref:Mobilization protein n=1 Tax=Pinibacter soli TaxID=3044211 RepID=A0ABT6RFH9_9BACT|nr:mobilization protein [Pinibacter soli]MDI3321312.1 mobilization protein [Pinibacter soli]